MKITIRLLKSLYACPPGIQAIKRRLPITFHKDPEKNMDLAILLIRSYAQREFKNIFGSYETRSLTKDLFWLLNRLSYKKENFCRRQSWNIPLLQQENMRAKQLTNDTTHPFIVAQIMGWIAD